MKTFEAEVSLPVSTDEAFHWHERPGALDRLIPPWEQVEVVERARGLDVGSQVVLLQHMGPLRMKWVAEHTEYEPNLRFRDQQQSGPFSHWDHVHEFKETSDGCVLRDHIEYAAPGGALGAMLAGGFVENKIAQMFQYRQRTTEADLAARKRYGDTTTMHIAITGSTGLVGSELIPLLTTNDHQITRLVRREPEEGEARWDPQADTFDASKLEGVDAVVHLAGDGIADGRWNEAKKQRLRSSRVDATRTFCEGLVRMENPPKVLVVASAIGYYGDRGDEVLDEKSEPGDNFLADLAKDWEAATEPAKAAGIRVVNLRFGVLLSPRGGALAKMLTPFKLGGGGVVGSGEQYWSWLSIDDAAGAIYHALMTEELSGPVNATAPNPVTNKVFTKTLGSVLNRPTIIPMPAFAARLALGQMADELLLASARVIPNRLMETGYQFRHPTLEGSLRHVLGRNKI